jgi:hypothetical protein
MALFEPTAYYRAVLLANGRTIHDEEEALQKVASVNNRPLHIVKLAQAFYEQLQHDEALAVNAGEDVWYDDPATRSADAFKMAEAYYEQQKDILASAESTINSLAEKMSALIAGWAGQAGLTDAKNALKLARVVLEKIAEPLPPVPPEFMNQEGDEKAEGDDKETEAKSDDKDEDNGTDKKDDTESGSDKTDDKKDDDKKDDKKEARVDELSAEKQAAVTLVAKQYLSILESELSND